MPIPEICADLDLGALSEEMLIQAQDMGEDPEKKCAIIEELRDLILAKGECTPKKTDNECLTKFLRARFWKIEPSYALICNYCNFRDENRELYEKVNPLDLRHVGDANIVSVAPYKDQLGRRIIIFRFGNWIPSEIPVDDIFKTALLLLELGAIEPAVQVLGGIGIFDLAGLSFNHVWQLSPSVAQKMLALIVTSMPIRTNAIHIVNQNWAFSAAFNCFKPFLNAKMRERLFIHGNDMSSLHKFVSPDHLPKRYGGVHEDYSYSMWIENLIKKDKIIEELEDLGYMIQER